MKFIYYLSYFILFSCALVLNAQTTYTYSGNGNWTDQSNWSPSYPNSSFSFDDTIIITNQTINVNTNVVANGTIIMNGNGRLEIDSNRELFLRGDIFINGVGGILNYGELDVINDNPTFYEPEIVVGTNGFVNNFNIMEFKGTVNGRIENFGTLGLQENVTISNSGRIINRENSSAVINTAFGGSGGTVTNNGLIDIRVNSSFIPLQTIVNNSTINNSGTFRNRFRLNNEVMGQIINNGVFVLADTGGSSRLTNRGVFTNAPNSSYIVEGNLNRTINESTFNNNNNAIFSAPSNYSITNTGILNNFTTGQINAGITISNSGVFNNFGVYGFTLTLLDAALFNNYGTFTGIAQPFSNTGYTFTGNTNHIGNYNNTGTIAPKAPSNSIGTYTLNGDLINNGNIIIEIRSLTEFDKLISTGSLTNNNVCTVSLLNNFEPQIGESFEIINYNSTNFNINAFNLPPLPNGRIWDVDINPNAVVLNVICGFETLICPDDVTINSDLNSCFATNVNLGNLPGNLCASFTASNDAPTDFPVGNTTVTWTVTGPSDVYTCTQTVTVLDSNTPSFTCTPTIQADAETDACGALVTVPAPLLTAVCPVTAIICSPQVTFNTFTINNFLDNTFTTISNAPSVQDNFVMNVIVNGPFFESSERFILEGPDGNILVNESRIRPECVDTSFPVNISAALWNGWISTFGPDLTFKVRRNTSTRIDTPNCGNYFQLCIPQIAPVEASITNDYNNTDNATDNYPVGQTTVNWTAQLPDGTNLTCSQVIEVIDNLGPTFDSLTLPNMSVSRSVDELTGFYTLEDFTQNVVADDNCLLIDITQNPTSGTQLNTGNYTITLSAIDDNNNVTTYDFSLNIEDNSLGINGFYSESVSVSIIPNPANTSVQIKLENNNTLISARLFNLLGQKIFESNKLELDVSSLANGIYLLKINSTKGTSMKKIIVKH